MADPTERFVDTNGVRLRVLEAGERGAPVVVLAHGFPELAYSWRHQIPVLAAAGYHVIAPDQRGYGGSSRPEAITDYDIVALTGDLAGLLDDAGAQRAVLVGHDWGSPVVTNFALLHPDRVAGLVNLSVPPVPRASAPPVQIWRRMVGDNFFYILYFQEPGVADADLGRDPRQSLQRMLAFEGFTAPASELADRPLPPLPAWLSETEFEHYADAFTRTGFTGGLNWYRCQDRNWALLAPWQGAVVTPPALYVVGTRDPVFAFPGMDGLLANLRMFVPNLRETVLLDGCGHWTQQERPDEVSERLVAFCREVAGAA